MDEQTNTPLEEKSNQSDIKRRYDALVCRWSNISHPNRTLLKLLPVFVLLFAVALTVKLAQTQQNIRQNAASNIDNIPSSIDNTGNSDVSSALNAFIASVPDGSIIVFPANATYLLSQGLQFANRNNLEFQGNGTTLKTTSSAAGSNQLSSPFVLGHTYNGSWNDNNNNIKIHDFTLVGNNPNPGVFTSGQEGESGMEIEGTNNLTIYNITVKSVWSDGFKIGDASNTVRIYNSHVVDAGRNGVSTISGSNIEIDHNVFDKIGYVTFDVEPNTSSESNTFQDFHDNTFGTWGSEFFALDGSHTGASIHDITVNNNTGIGRSLLTFVNNGGTARNTNIIFTNNKSNATMTGPVLNFAHIDGLTVYGNTQPLTSGSLASITDSTNVVTSAPTPTPTSAPTTAFNITSGPTAGSITNTGATIAWYLSDYGTGQVEYGTSLNYGLLSTPETSFNWNYHVQSLSGLSPGTTYHYRVKSTNQSGVTVYSSDHSFATTGNIAAPTNNPTPTLKPTVIPTPIPTTTPVTVLTVSSVAVSGITSSTANVSWYPSQPATGQVQYGTTTSYGLASTLETNYLTYHKQALSNLTRATTYHFRVVSEDAAGNFAVSSDYTFKTLNKSCTQLFSWKLCF